MAETKNQEGTPAPGAMWRSPEAQARRRALQEKKGTAAGGRPHPAGCLMGLGLLVVLPVALFFAFCSSSSEEEARTATPRERIEACLSGWDSNHDGFERQIRAGLNDPDSMTTYGTYFNSSDPYSDGTYSIRMEYGARNAFGGMVRTEATGRLNVNTCRVSVISYGY